MTYKRKPYKRKYPRELCDPREHGNGFVLFMDKRKLKNDGWDDQVEPEIRKPSPAEREEIVLNYIKANSGKAIKVSFLAKKLGVTVRTIQNILAKLKKQGLIKTSMPDNKNNSRSGNIIEYIGADKTLTQCNLENLYNPDNPYGFRDWDWDEYKVILGDFDEHFTKQHSQNQYERLKAERARLKALRDRLLAEANESN